MPSFNHDLPVSSTTQNMFHHIILLLFFYLRVYLLSHLFTLCVLSMILFFISKYKFHKRSKQKRKSTEKVVSIIRPILLYTILLNFFAQYTCIFPLLSNNRFFFSLPFGLIVCCFEQIDFGNNNSISNTRRRKKKQIDAHPLQF